MSELPPFMKTREEAIAYTVAEVIGDILRCYDLLTEHHYDAVLMEIRTYLKPDLDRLERLVGKPLEHCRKAYDDVIACFRAKIYEASKTYFHILAKNVCIEPYQVLAGSK